MRVHPKWFAEEVEVRPFSGSGPYGDVFADSFTALADVDSRRSLVRAPGGEEVVGEATVKLPPALADGRDPLQVIPEQSEITYRGRTGVVLVIKPYTVRGRVVYVEVTTT